MYITSWTDKYKSPLLPPAIAQLSLPPCHTGCVPAAELPLPQAARSHQSVGWDHSPGQPNSRDKNQGRVLANIIIAQTAVGSGTASFPAWLSSEQRKTLEMKMIWSVTLIMRTVVVPQKIMDEDVIERSWAEKSGTLTWKRQTLQNSKCVWHKQPRAKPSVILLQPLSFTKFWILGAKV